MATRYRNMEATVQGNTKTVAFPVVMVSLCSKHNGSINMEATFKGNPKTLGSAVEMVTLSTKHTRSGNMEVKFKGSFCYYGLLQL